MRQIYTNENRLLAINSKNILEQAGILVQIKNEYCSDGAIPGHQAWLELWVDDQDYPRALELLTPAESTNVEPWDCQQCHQQNPSQFNICWNCQTASSAPVSIA